MVKNLNIAKPVIDCDVLVSMPKLKTHQLTKYTGAVKNFYGVIPGTGKAVIHREAPSEESLSQAVVDIYSALKPQLAVMDGIVGMSGWILRNPDTWRTGCLNSYGNLYSALWRIYQAGTGLWN